MAQQFNHHLRTGDVRLENVGKMYRMGQNIIHALNNISVYVKRGEFMAIMGHSGSGKSTLLNILGCLDHPTSGKYLLDDQDVSLLGDNELSELRLRQFGFIFQSFNLIPQLSVQENIALPLYYLGEKASSRENKSAISAQMVGLSERLNHRPNELSGGEQQRVAIARALVNNPFLLLADEPTGNLDTATGRQIMQLLTELNKQGKTVLVVTHESDIAAYADKCMYLQDGRIDRVETS